MIDFEQVSIVVPAFNEEKTIQELIERINKVSKKVELIVCSDGSTDKTASLAKDLGCIVLEHPYNIGNGATVKAGAKLATRPFVVFLDADLQHPPEEIPKLLEFFPEYDMVIGARTSENSTSLIRNFGNYLLIRVAESISGFKIDDLTSGFRAVKRDIFLKFAHLYPLKYSYPTTSTLAFFSSGFFVKYVPIVSISKRETGESKVSPIRDGFRFLHIIIRVIMTFHPQKVFLPASVIPFLTGMGLSIYQLVATGGIRSSGIILIVSAVVIFFNGMLAEQIAQLRRDLKK